MARSASKTKITRRSRKEIDRNYFLGDVFIRTGVAAGVAIAVIAMITPFSLLDALHDGMFEYVTIMTVFGAIGVGAFLFGRHLRHEATHWDIEEA